MSHPNREDELWLLERIATRSSCVRRRIGAAIFSSEGHLLATGFNHPAEFGQTCADDCPRAKSTVAAYSSYKDGPGKCIAIHAEDAALRHAAQLDTEGGIMLVTAEPCSDCLALLEKSGLKEWRVVSS